MYLKKKRGRTKKTGEHKCTKCTTCGHYHGVLNACDRLCSCSSGLGVLLDNNSCF